MTKKTLNIEIKLKENIINARVKMESCVEMAGNGFFKKAG